jgi:hypothetical protein
MMRKNERGQALLLVLLGMSVILVVAMSVVSQSISDVSVSTNEEESLRAFSAAEAGIEESLINGIDLGETISQPVSDESTPKEVTYTAEAKSFPDNKDYIYPAKLLSGDSATIWFKSHDADGNLVESCASPSDCYTQRKITIYWGETNNDTALEASLWYLAGGVGPLTVKRVILDPGHHSASESLQGNLIPATYGGNYTLGPIDGKNYTFTHSKTLDFPNDFNISNPTETNQMYLLRLRALLNEDPETIGISAQTNKVPSQGKKIESTGSSGSSLRKIQVFELYPDIPGFFDAAITSGTSIVK